VILKRGIILFVEDEAHETFVSVLVQRLADESNTDVRIAGRSVRGGHGRVITEFQKYLRNIHREREGLPDLLIVATDANCKGYPERRKEIDEKNKKLKGITVCAIPDPHIERWLLIDSSAFKKVLGKGCKSPDQKCSRDRYKKLLLEAIQHSGIIPLVKGIEHAREIVNAMDFKRAARMDCSFNKLLTDLTCKFKEWKRK